jgi:hypothetical protein
MTISDDPDEDADNLDDDALIEAYLGTGTRVAQSNTLAADAGQEMPEWPPLKVRNIELTIDSATIAWFVGNHADWRREIGYVLRAWVAAQPDHSRKQTVAE